MKITGSQKRHLRRLAHQLKPVVMVGQHGLKAGLFDELEAALNAHELIKVRIAADREERKTLTAEILERTHADLVQAIGQMIVIFRRNEKKPKIELPAPSTPDFP
ncbi:MAG TPA: ribosome assembly RNA-binding protein YhbY [Sedimenticola sp.]|nr:ribosome assembly RNA-binding protein YhbY [Sedimenticola sp.]